MLDVVILGATEVDRKFNVNVNIEADSVLLHCIGSHQDTAAGAKLTIIAQPLLCERISCATEQVLTVTTPGEVVDAIFTEYGITINPHRKDLINACSEIKYVPVISMYELAKRSSKMVDSEVFMHNNYRAVKFLNT